ncbi:T9SS type A sorting domain-containing protein [Hymenobacter sp. 15J16-1T3B]|uniref:fibronectin type III domain-containing protein n=1 Tax=Hymenobacter sp. 15J16-1T3B TaxID=2886941 RepID=UPI001D12A9EA|nr:T9SS type A sorting domain-containing protein [Hymenobacter sp. 15J16-1T3B]MCC3157838.1 T9SS type A sorting domain-containing protein [Hymenobacter sp. 15J16-1T3B]
MRTSLRMWPAPAPRRGLRSWWLPVLLWLTSVSVWAQTTTIGSTTIPVASPATSSYLYGPIYRSANDAGSSFDYSRYAYLYTAAELGISAGSVISELAWLKADAGTVTGNNTFTVWLENSTSTTLGTTQTWSAISATATQVYTSSSQQVTGGAGSYFIVTLNQPFTYTGGNLLILTDWVKQGSASAAVNFVTNAATGFGLGAANSTALTSSTALTTTYGNRRPTLRLTHGACSAPPTAGTTTASATAICAATTVSFSLQGSASGSGLSYQWQSSTNGTTYTNISGATSPSYSTSVTATTYYRAVVTCSGQSANSTPVQVTYSAPTYATLPYTQGFDNAWVDACSTRDVPSNNWRMTASPADPDASWRRDDDGAAAGWTSPTYGVYNPTFTNGTNSARFHSGYASSGTVGTLDLYVNLSQAGTKQLTFDYINVNGADSLTVHLSTDGGVTFGPALLRRNTAATWTPLTLTTTASSATAVIRFRARGDFGSTDIGLDNLSLTVLPSCTTPPVAGTAVASVSTICSPTAVALSLTGITPSTGLTYQWQSSTNGTTYTNISGATNDTYTAAGVATTTYFRAVVTCSGQSANSTAVQVTYTAPTYATLPYTQGFDNAWVDVCGTRDVPSNNWRSTPSPADADASWRRDDDGAAGGWTGPSSGIYNPTFSNGTNSARFHTYNASSGTVGTLDLYVNLSQAGTKQLTFDYINTTGTDSLTVHLSTDGGVTFGPALLRRNTASTWTNQVLSLTSTSATAVIRFRGRSDFGTTDIGLDNLSLTVLPNCTTPPVAGTAVASVSTICSPTAVALSLTGITPSSGLSYQWQSSTNGTTYTNISGATNDTYTAAGVAATTYYRAVVTCSGQSANSTAVQVTYTVPTYASLPYSQDFDNAWVDACGTRDVPSNNWRAKAAPTDADASWRRDDDGAAGGWTGPTSGIYSPTASQGTNSARFHTYNATSGTVGTLDLYANLSATNSKLLTFDFINTTGTDSLTVHLSTDGGVTFGPALLRLNTAATWSSRSVTITSTSATAVIRFRGRSDFGTTDIGLDNVNLVVLNPCTTPPVAGTAVASVSTICSPTAVALSLTGIPASTGLTYQWQSSTNGTTYTNISGATSPTYTAAGVATTTYFRAVVTCSGQSANSTAVQVTYSVPTYASLPALENFDNTWVDACGTRNVPSNSWRSTPSPTDADASWRRDDDGAAGGWTGPTSGAYSPAASQGINSARFHTYNASSGTVGTLDYYVNLSQAGNKRLTFDFINTTGTDSLTVHLSTDGGVTFGPALLRLNTATAWTNQVLTLTSTSATAVIRFRGRSDFGLTDIGLDNVRVESATGCLSPAGLTVGTTTTTTAVLNWVNSGSGNYTVEYGPIGFALGTGTQVTGITGTTTTLTGLTPGTPYQFYVIQNCGTTTSAAGGPVVFNTQITNDDPTGAIALTVNTACTPTSGTNVGATTTTVSGYLNPGTGTTGCGTAGSPKDVWYKFTTAATGPTSTAVRISVTGTPASQVRAFSATSAAGPFTQIGCSANSSTSVAPNLDLTALAPSTTYYVRVSGYGSTDPQGPFTICVSLLPNCQDPVVPTVASVTSSSASLYWGGVQTSGSTYEIEYGLQGFTLNSGTRITGIAGQTATLNTLASSTDYCFYVRQNCGTVNGFSAWVGPICFTTDPGAATNDEPCSAIAATVSSGGYVTLSGTTLGATTTTLPGITLPACSPALSPKDVWFRVTLPSNVTAINASFSGSAAGMVRLFTAATCSTSFAQVGCQASGGNNQSVGAVNFTGLTGGTTYYMAVSGYGSGDNRGQFTTAIITAQKNQLAGGDVAIFPNPVVGGAELNVQISGAKSGALHCEIINALGQVVQTRTAEVRNGNLQQTLTTTGLAKGLYQVRLRIGSDVLVRKVMVD